MIDARQLAAMSVIGYAIFAIGGLATAAAVLWRWIFGT